MAWCQGSQVPPHEVCAILKHQLHYWKNSLQNLTALIAVVHPYVLWPLHDTFQSTFVAEQVLVWSCYGMQCGQQAQKVAAMLTSTSSPLYRSRSSRSPFLTS